MIQVYVILVILDVLIRGENMFYILIALGAVLGVIVGKYLPVIPYTYSVYVSVTILAILDTILGAIASKLKGRFDFKVFISGFFGNALLTIMLVYLGIKLNLDIHIAAVVVFVSRMFNNLSIIRRHYIEKFNNKKSRKSK
mgnify:FL=1